MAASFQLECDFDCNDMKLERANGRAASLWKKRCAYQRSIEQKSRTFRQLSKAPITGNPHRAARSATRTCVAQGSLAVDADMPSISFACKPWRKPSVVNKMSQAINDLDEAETTATDGSEYSDAEFDEPCNSAPQEEVAQASESNSKAEEANTDHVQNKQSKKKKKVSFQGLDEDTNDKAAKIAKAAAQKLREEELAMIAAAAEEMGWEVLDEVSANTIAADGEWALA